MTFTRRFHGARAAHRAPAAAGWSRAVQRLGGNWLLPDRSPPSGQRSWATSTSAAGPSRSRSVAMIPVRVENLLPAAKNLGVTHIHQRCVPRAPGRMERGRGRRTSWRRSASNESSRRDPCGTVRNSSKSSGTAAARGHRTLLAEFPTPLRMHISGEEFVLKGLRAQAQVPRGDTCVCRKS